MGGEIPLLFSIILLCASGAETQTTTYPTTEYTSARNCRQRDGTSITLLMDVVVTGWSYSGYIRQVLNRLSARFLCVTRNYTSVILDYEDTSETSTADKEEFLSSISGIWIWDYYYHSLACSQSLLYGLKRALLISPPESLIWVFTIGSMADYNDTQLLSEVYDLLKEKKPQVYIMLHPWYCSLNPAQLHILRNISLLSYGEIIFWPFYDPYQIMSSLERLFSKPLNIRRQALNIKPNSTGNYTGEFNLTTSLTHLLITRDYRFTLNITDPSGNAFAFNKFPDNDYYDYDYYYSYHYYYYDNYCNLYFGYEVCSDAHVISTHLMKNPTSGTWTLEALGNSSSFFSAQIFGFTELDPAGRCSDGDCHPNATCTEFGGYGECTCKEGFSGDGYVCEDIDECQDSDYNSCWWWSGSGFCENTVGSYSCICHGGYRYVEQFGCFDIDECSDPSLNDCHPLADCWNYHGSYTCTCRYGYYGDGKYCEVNECQLGTPCNPTEDCIKYRGSYSCYDPCSSHMVLNDPWRSTNNTNGYMYHCDYSLQGWYRFKGEYNQTIPEYCVPSYSCGTQGPMWMNGSHPAASKGIVNRTACASYNGYCCQWSTDMSVKMCPGGFYVYKLYSTPICSMAYCTESNVGCSGIACAADEECRDDGGAPGCRCKDSAVINNGSATLTGYRQPQVTCGLDNIQVTFSKCVLEKLGYDTSSVYLRDNSCRGVTDRRDKSYITIVTRPRNASCGAEMSVVGSNIRYRNTVYLSFLSDGVIIRNEQPINFNCDYPQNMEINLLSAINPFTVSVPIEVNGMANYTVTMGLFQDSGYTIPYNGSEVWISSSATLYVGVIASGASGPSAFVINMKNCYSTPTANPSGIRHDIIINQCPNRNDPTVSVLENGVSLKGRFSVQMFKFVSSSQVYLHCQVGLCDSSSSTCSANCPVMRMGISPESDKTMTMGPIKNQDFVAPGQGPASAGEGAAVTLLVPAIALLALLYQQNDY